MKRPESAVATASPFFTNRLFLFLASVALLAITAIGIVPQASAQATPDATATESISIIGDVSSPGPITVAELQAFPNESLDVTFTSGGEPQDHTYVGTPLLGVLDAAGLIAPEGAKNPLLTQYFVVTAKDGYQVIISGGELDPAFGNTPMYLAWEEDGAALTGDDGPIRLVVPNDTKGGRYVSGVVSIEVFTVGGSSATPAA